MNRELRKNGLKTRVIIVLLLVAFILLGFRIASNSSPNEYGETDTVPEARVTYANASSDAASQLYKALLNRETNFSITCGNSSDVYTRLENEELFKEVASKDDPNTSDDFDYLFNNVDSYTITDNGGRVDISVTWNEDKAMLDKVNARGKEILQQTGVYNMNNAYDIAKTLPRI